MKLLLKRDKENTTVMETELNKWSSNFNDDYVIIVDPWWNPAAEAQATDRAHRIGQTRTVTSIKLIAAGTIEERVMELQKSKSEMLRKLLTESDSVSSGLSLDVIKDLLRKD